MNVSVLRYSKIAPTTIPYDKEIERVIEKNDCVCQQHRLTPVHDGLKTNANFAHPTTKPTVSAEATASSPEEKYDALSEPKA